MIKRLRLVAVLCAAGLAIPVLAAAQTGAEQEVLKAEQARFAAFVSADVNALKALFGDDLTYIHSSGALQDKATMVGGFESGRTRYKAFTGKDLKARVMGNTAVVNGLADVTTLANGKEGAPFTIRYTAVHVNRGGKWELVAFQATRPPDKP